MNKDQLIEHLANFFLHEFREDAVGVAEWLVESEGIEDVDTFVEAVQSAASL